MNRSKSPTEHCLACLSHLRLLVRATKTSQDDLETMLESYARSLATFEPQAVSAACKRAAEELGYWPSLKEILGFVRDEQALKSLPGPAGEGEAFDARLRRMGFSLLDFTASNMPLWSDLMTTHRSLDDEAFSAGCRRVLSGERYRRPLVKADVAA